MIAVISLGLCGTARASGFNTPASYPLSEWPYAVLGDFNGDGYLDVASLGSYSVDNGAITVLLNNGDGSYTTEITYTTLPSGPDALFATDLNHDGKLDLVAVSSNLYEGDGTVSILLGNGDGTFQAPTGYSTAGEYPVGWALGDVNGDGNVDIIISNWYGGGYAEEYPVLAVLYGDGNGGISNTDAETFNYFGIDGKLTAGDFNGDGKCDIAMTNGSEIAVFLSNGFFGQTPSYYNAGTVGVVEELLSGDVNGDGALDLVAQSGPTISVLLGSGNGTFQSPILSSDPVANSSFALADINGDGKLDIVSGGYNGMDAILGNGDGTFQPATLYNLTGPSEVLVGDVSGDGKPDVVAPSAGILTVVIGNGDGTFRAPSLMPASVGALTVADFNNDGKADLATISGTEVSIFLGNGDGTFQNPMNFAAAQIPLALTVADFNRDGNADIAVGNKGRNISILLGNGDGTFRAPVNFNKLSNDDGVSLAAGDFNGDGLPDLAVVQSVFAGIWSSSLNVFLNKGGGILGDPTVYPLGRRAAAQYVVAASFNTGSKVDLGVSTGGGIAIFRGNGDGTFQDGVLHATGYTLGNLKLGDFNNDGYLDIGMGARDIVVLPGDGGGAFGYPILNSASVSEIDVADFNGDGDLDVAAAGFSVFLGKGNGRFTNPHSYGTGASYVAAGEFNGDNAPDVVLNVGSGLVVLLNTGGTFDTLKSSPNPSTLGQPVTFTATVSASVKDSPGGQPTGSVTFKDGSVTLGTASLSDQQASFTTSALTSGTHSITADYSGDANFNPNTSAVLLQVVN